jgi:membrane protein YdbS with pleckstrin-like domain
MRYGRVDVEVTTDLSLEHWEYRLKSDTLTIHSGQLIQTSVSVPPLILAMTTMICHSYRLVANI